MSSKRQHSPVEGGLQVSVTPLHPSSTVRTLVPATLITGAHSHLVSALIDSGADGNFMDTSLASELHLAPAKLQTSLEARALTGVRFSQITHVTPPVSLLISGNQENLVFHMLDSSTAPIVLGRPWLVKHNPHIDWANNTILGWSPFCLNNCLKNAHTLLSAVSPATDDSLDLSEVLPGSQGRVQ